MVFHRVLELEAYEKDTNAKDTAEALADSRKHAALDGDYVNTTVQMVARYLSRLSYRPLGNLGTMRYLTISTVR